MNFLKSSTLAIIFLISNSLFGQDSKFEFNHTILGSLHLANYLENDEFQMYKPKVGVAIEYRKNIKTFSEHFHLSLGFNFESLPTKRFYENNDDYYMDTPINLTIPFGLYYSSGSYYFGTYISFDAPFASIEDSEFGGVKYKHTEFIGRLLNLNFSAGLNIGKIVYFSNHQIHIELHFKALALVGLKSNDYWLYPEDHIPYYSGIKIGYGF